MLRQQVPALVQRRLHDPARRAAAVDDCSLARHQPDVVHVPAVLLKRQHPGPRPGDAVLPPCQVAVFCTRVGARPKGVGARRRIPRHAARGSPNHRLDEVDAVELAVGRADERAGRVNRVLCLDHTFSLVS